MPTDKTKMILDKFVAARSAKLLYASFSELSQSKEIALWWPGQDDYTNQEIIDALDNYGSSLNYPNQRMYVINPFADTEKCPGTFRIVNNRLGSKAEGGGIVQILREGWATSLSEDEARIGGYFVDTQNGTYGFKRYWPNVAITSLMALATGLKNTKTVANPKARAVTHTGTFAVGPVTGTPQEDGAGVVEQTLRFVYSPTNISTLDDITPVVRIGSQIIDPIVLDAIGSAATGLQDTARSASLTFRALAVTDAVRLVLEETIKPSEFESSFTGTGKILTTGWKYLSRSYTEDPESNTAVFSVNFDRNTNVNVTPHVERVSDDQVSRTWYRVDATTKDALIVANATPASRGIAVKEFDYDHDKDGTASTFTHAALYVTDNHDRTFNVQQVGTRKGDGAGVNIYYSKSFTTKDPEESRIYNKIAQTKQRIYTHHVKYYTGEEWAIAAIQSASATNDIVEGSVNVKTIRPNYVKAQWTEITNNGTWA